MEYFFKITTFSLSDCYNFRTILIFKFLKSSIFVFLSKKLKNTDNENHKRFRFQKQKSHNPS
jgi:hypothetical protein